MTANRRTRSVDTSFPVSVMPTFQLTPAVRRGLAALPLILACAGVCEPAAAQGLALHAGITGVSNPASTVCARDLGTFLEGRLARFEMPAHLWIHAGPLPRTASGKIFKHGVRGAVLDGAPAYRPLRPA